MVASESLWLNRAAPSIDPQNSASRATASRRCARLVRVDKPGVQVRVDRHLLARHRIESETRRHFGGAYCAVTHHKVLNGNESDER